MELHAKIVYFFLAAGMASRPMLLAQHGGGTPQLAVMEGGPNQIFLSPMSPVGLNVQPQQQQQQGQRQQQQHPQVVLQPGVGKGRVEVYTHISLQHCSVNVQLIWLIRKTTFVGDYSL